MASNRGTRPLKPSDKIWIRPLVKVLDRFGKDDPAVRYKLPVEVDIPEWLCMKGLGKESTEHEQAIGDGELNFVVFPVNNREILNDI